jgi:xanthine/uracil permease
MKTSAADQRRQEKKMKQIPDWAAMIAVGLTIMIADIWIVTAAINFMDATWAIPAVVTGVIFGLIGLFILIIGVGWFEARNRREEEGRRW